MQSSSSMPSLNELNLFDSCVTLGRFTGDTYFQTADDLIVVLDRYQIAEALVHEFHARSLYPLENGNRRLLEMIKGQSRLCPVWVLEPPLQPGRQSAERMVDEMLAAGVRAARLRLPAKGSLPWVWEDLCAALAAHCVPCFFDFGPSDSTLGALQDHEVDALRAIALAYPDLPIILSHVMGGLGVHPAVMYLIHRTPNVYLDIAGILEYWRTVAKDVGPERVLFATGMPFTDPGILISNIQYARDLDLRAKQLICGGNLRRLIGGVR